MSQYTSINMEEMNSIDLNSMDDLLRKEMLWDKNTESIIESMYVWIKTALADSKREKRICNIVNRMAKLLILLTGIMNLLLKYFVDQTWLNVIVSCVILLANGLPEIMDYQNKLLEAERKILDCVMNILIDIKCELGKHKKNREPCDQFLTKILCSMKNMVKKGPILFFKPPGLFLKRQQFFLEKYYDYNYIKNIDNNDHIKHSEGIYLGFFGYYKILHVEKHFWLG